MDIIEIDRLTRPRWVVFKTADKYQEQDLYFASWTGYISPPLRGTNEPETMEDYTFELDFTPALQQIAKPEEYADINTLRPVYSLKNWTVFAGLNDIYNAKDANEMRFGVISFHMIRPYEGQMKEESWGLRVLLMDKVKINCQLIVQDSDDYLKGVAVRVTALIHFVGWGWK